MKFVSMWFPEARCHDHVPGADEQAAMGALIGEMMNAGVLVDTGGVMAGGESLRLKRAGTEVSVTDGPFTESKEMVGGFALLKVGSRLEAEAWTRRFLDLAGDGTAELHEVSELP
jgi:hypothetical protein